MLPNFVARAVNKVLNAIIPQTPDATPNIPAPYTNQYDACVGLREAHLEEFNAIARRHYVQGHGVRFNNKTGDPEFLIVLVKGDKSDINDIPKQFKDGLPVVVEYRGIARG